jgi:glycosyltransferase involved in cell wall biosynthesis
MNILMMTNTFTPHVGGVARSIERFTAEYRERGHRVVVVAPEFENMPENESDVIRVPAMQRFNGSDFSVAIRMPRTASSRIERFKPDIIHSHHPFLIGGTAVRTANRLKLPLVFTHHTMYEQYTHYIIEDSGTLKDFVVRLSTNYANLCDLVFAPSESIADIIGERGVETPVEVVPTGVEIERFKGGSGPGFRAVMNIPEHAFIVGHLGRLAPEKNLEFLAESVAAFLKTNADAHFLVVGAGPSRKHIREVFNRDGLGERLHFTGTLDFPVLVSAYRAMDVFAFASKSETQGMVLTEAMAAGTPVIALDAPGVREVVEDKKTGLLLHSETVEEFSSALRWIASLATDENQKMSRNAEKTAEKFSMRTSADTALNHYEKLCVAEIKDRAEPYEMWRAATKRIKAEWDLLTSVIDAAKSSLLEPESGEQ